jgi:hypothetical protein
MHNCTEGEHQNKLLGSDNLQGMLDISHSSVETPYDIGYCKFLSLYTLSLFTTALTCWTPTGNM